MQVMFDTDGKQLRRVLYKNNTKWKKRMLLQMQRYPGNYHVRLTDGSDLVMLTPKEYHRLKALEESVMNRTHDDLGKLVQAEVDKLNGGGNPEEIFAKLGEILDPGSNPKVSDEV